MDLSQQAGLVDYIVHGGPPVIALMLALAGLVSAGKLRLERELKREVAARVQAEKERDLAQQRADAYRERLEQRGSSLNEAVSLLELSRRLQQPSPRRRRTAT